VIYEVEGLKEVLDMLEKLETTARLIKPILTDFGRGILSTQGLQVYPPISEANMPRPGGWYQRGAGPRWYGGSGGRNTSEKLNLQWRTEVGDRELTLSNAASYAFYVHGDGQPGFHARRGWKKLGPTVAELMPRLVDGLRRKLHMIIK